MPLVYYNESNNPEPRLECYLRTEGNKVFWRSPEPEHPDWYLLYDFDLKVDDYVTLYGCNKDIPIEQISPETMICIGSNYNQWDSPLEVPMMAFMYVWLDDYSISQGPVEWIIGMGNPRSLLRPCLSSSERGGFCCVESPKGNVVYGEPPVAKVMPVNDSDFYEPKVSGVYNLQGVRIGDNREDLSSGIYIINGRKTFINQ